MHVLQVFQNGTIISTREGKFSLNVVLSSQITTFHFSTSLSSCDMHIVALAVLTLY